MRQIVLYLNMFLITLNVETDSLSYTWNWIEWTCTSYESIFILFFLLFVNIHHWFVLFLLVVEHMRDIKMITKLSDYLSVAKTKAVFCLSIFYCLNSTCFTMNYNHCEDSRQIISQLYPRNVLGKSVDTIQFNYISHITITW
jgi:hypothetical protein